MRFVVLIFLLTLLTPMVGADPDHRPRDVIGSAWDHPLVTDAEVVRYISDTHAVIEVDGGQALIRYPGITSVRVKGEVVPVARAGPDLLAVELPSGVQEVEVLTGASLPKAAAADLRVPAVRLAGSPESFTELAEAAKPGDELVIADGVHRDWRVTISASGSDEEPIVIRSETPGGAVFKGDVRFRVTGNHVVLKGLRFEHCGPGVAIHLDGANNSRVTQCQFFHCGNPRSTFGHILRVDVDSHRNRVDHSFFTGSKSMSIGQRISGEGPVGRNNRYDHNIFRDIYRYWINGQENIQLGQDNREFGAMEAMATVELNVFDHAWGDPEIISIKSSRNIVRHNVAAHCKRASFVLRGGDYTRFEGNVVYNSGGGVRVLGTGHEIVNNLLVDNHTFGVSLETGSLVGNMHVAPDDTLVAHNTIIGSPLGIHAQSATDDRPKVARRTRIGNNVIVSLGGRLMDTEALVEAEILRNLLWGGETTQIGEHGEEAIIKEPLLTGEGPLWRPSPDSPVVGAGLRLPEVRLDRLGRDRPQDAAPDLGAEQARPADADGVLWLPPIPPAPLLEPGLYRGELLYASQEADTAVVLEDAAFVVGDPLPPDLVARWRYRPERWGSVATLTLKGAEGSGWSLTWGGADGEGRPRSGIELRDGAGDLLATGADVVYYYRDFRPGYGNMRGPEEPLEDRWYEFTLLLNGDELFLLLGIEGREPVPVMLWKNRETQVGGTLDLSLTQEGRGWWRGIEVHALDYLGAEEPPAPPNLKARVHDGSRIELTWGEPEYDARDYVVEVHRSTRPEFTPSEETVVAPGVRGSAWDDFVVEPQTSYYYALRARNALGLTSDLARIEATSGEGGPFYLLIPAAEVKRLEPPMVLTSARSNPDFIWAPVAAMSQQAPPDEGLARFAFHLPHSGHYSLWGLVQAPSSGADSFHVAINDGRFSDWHTGIHMPWGWSLIGSGVQFEAGEHTLSFKHREPATRLSAILITSHLEWDPAMRRSGSASSAF